MHPPGACLQLFVDMAESLNLRLSIYAGLEASGPSSHYLLGVGPVLEDTADRQLWAVIVETQTSNSNHGLLKAALQRRKANS